MNTEYLEAKIDWQAEALRDREVPAVVLRRHLRALLRPLHPEHQLRRRRTCCQAGLLACRTAATARPEPRRRRVPSDVADDSPSVRSPRGGQQSLWQVRAAQLRARATKQAIVQVLLGSIFLVGALAYARAPDRHAQASLAWMAGLLVLSTFDVGAGPAHVGPPAPAPPARRLWVVATAAWGLLSTALVVFLRG